MPTPPAPQCLSPAPSSCACLSRPLTHHSPIPTPTAAWRSKSPCQAVATPAWSWPSTRRANWAGEVFAAISTAYREATGDPDALSEDELAALPPADVYRPGPGTHFCGEGDRPAVVRFHVVVDVEGECLDAGPLRAALVEHISERFNTTRVAVSEGFAIAGRAS